MKDLDGRIIPTINGFKEYDNGGKGSGNFGHSGRPGEVGGSGDGTGGPKNKKEDEIAPKLKGVDVYAEYGTELKVKSGWNGPVTFFKVAKELTAEELKNLKKKVAEDQKMALKERDNWKDRKEWLELGTKSHRSKEEEKRYKKLDRDYDNLHTRAYVLTDIKDRLKDYKSGKITMSNK